MEAKLSQMTSIASIILSRSYNVKLFHWTQSQIMETKLKQMTSIVDSQGTKLTKRSKLQWFRQFVLHNHHHHHYCILNSIQSNTLVNHCFCFMKFHLIVFLDAFEDLLDKKCILYLIKIFCTGTLYVRCIFSFPR